MDPKLNFMLVQHTLGIRSPGSAGVCSLSIYPIPALSMSQMLFSPHGLDVVRDRGKHQMPEESESREW